MNKTQLSRRIAVLAVLIGLSTLGRFLFAWIPGFKPLGAVAIIAGMYMGPGSGFLVGSLSIVISNFYFGHGPWTLFQIGALGLIGLMAGVLGPILRRNRILLVVYGIFAAFLFSGVMDFLGGLLAGWRIDAVFSFVGVGGTFYHHLRLLQRGVPLAADEARGEGADPDAGQIWGVAVAKRV